MCSRRIERIKTGTTRIYTVDKDDDKVEATYPWYAKDIYLMNTGLGEYL